MALGIKRVGLNCFADFSSGYADCKGKRRRRGRGLGSDLVGLLPKSIFFRAVSRCHLYNALDRIAVGAKEDDGSRKAAASFTLLHGKQVGETSRDIL